MAAVRVIRDHRGTWPALHLSALSSGGNSSFQARVDGDQTIKAVEAEHTADNVSYGHQPQLGPVGNGTVIRMRQGIRAGVIATDSPGQIGDQHGATAVDDPQRGTLREVIRITADEGDGPTSPFGACPRRPRRQASLPKGSPQAALFIVEANAACCLNVLQDCRCPGQDQGLWDRMPVSAERELREVRYVTDVLVAHATKNGSTQQVAEAITVALREAGSLVTALPARGVRASVAGYELVVPGAPLCSGRWYRDAHRFLRRHQRELAAVPMAVFGMGPRSDTEEAWQRSRSQLDRALAKPAGLPR
jgi:menaquinone-dependent protoporphyrinogen oxidase